MHGLKRVIIKGNFLYLRRWYTYIFVYSYKHGSVILDSKILWCEYSVYGKNLNNLSILQIICWLVVL